MNKHTDEITYSPFIATPRTHNTTVKIDVILEQRMREFMLSRRRSRWVNTGD